MLQVNTSTNVLSYQTLKERASQLFPKLHTYDKDGNIIVPGYYLDEDNKPYPRYFEEFMWELEIYSDFEDEKGIRELALELDRVENGIHLIGDVSDFPDPEWLVEGFIVISGMTLLYGFPGTLKTTFMMYATDAIQKGKDLFGLKCKTGSVIWVEQDESGDLLKSHRVLVGLPYPLNIAKCDVMWDAGKRQFNDNLETILRYYQPDLLVIDSYTSLGIPDITRPESGLVLDELRRLLNKYRCALVIIHHPSQSGEQMGSTLHVAKMDSIASMRKMEKKIVFTQEKIRGVKFPEKILDVDEATLEIKESKGNLKSTVIDLVLNGVAKAEIMKSFPNTKKETLKRYIREAEAMMCGQTP